MPISQEKFEEEALIKRNDFGSLLYEEAMLKDSDSRFVLNWITAHGSEQRIALNYCLPESGEYDSNEKVWFFELRDNLNSRRISTKAKCVINCAGVWSDGVNSLFGITTPYRHVFSKGVFIGFRRTKGHNLPLIFEMGENGDALSYIPWGPVSLWGPTETKTDNIQNGFRVSASDVRFLMEQAHKNLRYGIDKNHIVSLRCGIRPLAVKRSFSRDCYPLDISRNHRIVRDPDMPWVTAYGGKITGCVSMAKKISAIVSRIVPPSYSRGQIKRLTPGMNDMTSFPGLEGKVPSVQWCMENEYCCTLEDYLRRRTCISQWIPREGLGSENENLPHLKKIAMKLTGNNLKQTEKIIEGHSSKVKSEFDQLIEKA